MFEMLTSRYQFERSRGYFLHHGGKDLGQYDDGVREKSQEDGDCGKKGSWMDQNLF
jgi:hypothetical protein